MGGNKKSVDGGCRRWRMGEMIRPLLRRWVQGRSGAVQDMWQKGVECGGGSFKGRASEGHGTAGEEGGTHGEAVIARLRRGVVLPERTGRGSKRHQRQQRE